MKHCYNVCCKRLIITNRAIYKKWKVKKWYNMKSNHETLCIDYNRNAVLKFTVKVQLLIQEATITWFSTTHYSSNAAVSTYSFARICRWYAGPENGIQEAAQSYQNVLTTDWKIYYWEAATFLKMSRKFSKHKISCGSNIHFKRNASAEPRAYKDTTHVIFIDHR